MKTAAKAWSAVCGFGVILGILTGVPSLLKMLGVDVGPVFGWFAANSSFLLPIACLAVGGAAGFGIGWNVRNCSAHKEADSVKEKLGMTVEEAATRLGEQKAEDQVLVDKVNGLPIDFKRLLAWLYVEERIDGSSCSDFSDLLDFAAVPGEVEEQNLFYDLVTIYDQPDGSKFFELKPWTRRIMTDDEKIFSPFIEEVKSGGLKEYIDDTRKVVEDMRRRMKEQLPQTKRHLWERPPREIC